MSGVAGKRLADEGRHDAPVAQPHARTVGVKDADDLGIDAVIAVIGHRHRFGETFRFIVNAARPDRVHVAPVIFLLRMDERIAVAFGGGGEEERRLLRLRQAKRVMRAERADFQRRDRQFEIINRAGGRGEMEDVIDLIGHEQILGHVLLDESVIFVPGEVLDVREVPGDEIVDRDHAMTFREQPVGQMRAEKPGAAGHDSDGLLAGTRGHGADYLNAGIALGEQKRAGAIRPKKPGYKKSADVTDGREKDRPQSSSLCGDQWQIVAAQDVVAPGTPDATPTSRARAVWLQPFSLDSA